MKVKFRSIKQMGPSGPAGSVAAKYDSDSVRSHEVDVAIRLFPPLDVWLEKMGMKLAVGGVNFYVLGTAIALVYSCNAEVEEFEDWQLILFSIPFFFVGFVFVSVLVNRKIQIARAMNDKTIADRGPSDLWACVREEDWARFAQFHGLQ